MYPLDSIISVRGLLAIEQITINCIEDINQEENLLKGFLYTTK